MSSLKHGLVFSSCVLGTDTEHVCLPEHTLQRKCIVKVVSSDIYRYIPYNHNNTALFFPVARGEEGKEGICTPGNRQYTPIRIAPLSSVVTETGPLPS